MILPDAASHCAPTPARLLGPNDPAPFTRQLFGRSLPAVLACDHASREVPRALGNLGLGAAQLARHIAWDIGAGALAAELARQLQLPLISGAYSRLVIDCNRRLDDPTSILEISDGDCIPGNLRLSATARSARALEIFMPYHAALATALAEAATASAPAPALIAIHSFTEVFGGLARPWHCGILWDRDPRLAVPLLAALRAEPGLAVGDNEPYSGRHPADYTIDTHAERPGRPHVCIEVRQDLLSSAAGIAQWAARLARPLGVLLADARLYKLPGLAEPSPAATASAPHGAAG